MLLPLDQIQGSQDRYESGTYHTTTAETESALEKSLGETGFAEEVVTTDAPPSTASRRLTVEENLEKRKEMLESVASEPPDFAFERAIGANDSVYSNFSVLLDLAKRKVGRIVVKNGSINLGYATGFMVSERLMLTNWHVFEAIDEVRNSEVQFFYELDITGRPTTPVTFKFSPNEFFHSYKDLDYCMLAVEPVDISGTVKLTSIGYLFLDPTLGKLGEEGKELLNIIHHPGGDYQQLSIRENQFTKIMDKSIWYRTDTAQGSSGSPVFNDQWQVVALHHSGVPSRNAQGQLLDKKGNVIVPVNGKVDETKVDWIANEGIRISVLLADLNGKHPGNTLLAGLKKAPAMPTMSPGIIPVIGEAAPHRQEGADGGGSHAPGDIKISFPPSALEATGSLSFTVTRGAAAANQEGAAGLKGALISADALLESKKEELETAMDYSSCRGYDPNFLGVKIPMPRPKTALLKFVAKLKGTNSSILNYHHFSTVHHSIRKMPIFAAINVDGDPALRLDTTEREDVWIRDNRLDYDMQLNDKYYASSGFDRGHMARREDANYGATAEDAKRNADLTCVYTNACPQVPKLNRSSNSGLWGKLEKLILEKGAEAESGKSARISVFNGPIFADDDRFYKGVQVPMAFWKLVLWFDEAHKLKATAFKLSQSGLVSGIDFEKLDFDTNAQFLDHQCSIAHLEKVTSLSFPTIKKFDTYKGTDPGGFHEIASEDAFREFLATEFKAGK